MPAPWVSFDEVKARVTIEQVLRHYGLLDTMTRKGEKLSGLCHFHDDAKTKSFKVDLDKNVYNCFGACQAGGDVLDLVVAAERIETGNRTSNRRRAALLLAEWFGIESKREAKTVRQRAGKRANAATNPLQTEGETATGNEEQPETAADEGAAVINPPLKFELKGIDPGHPYLFERGLTKETIETFGLGYCSKGIHAGRIAIPIHNEAGELVAYAGRWPGDEGWPEGEEKYKMPSRENGFFKSHLLFNLHRAKPYSDQGLIVVEGFFSGVFALWQKNRRNVVAVMGSHLSPEQEKLIVETVGPKGKVLIGFDPDPAGRKGMQDAAARLAPQVFVRTVELT